jgi:hypothetical protein
VAEEVQGAYWVLKVVKNPRAMDVVGHPRQRHCLAGSDLHESDTLAAIMQSDPTSRDVQCSWRHIDPNEFLRLRLLEEADKIVTGPASEVEHPGAIMPSDRHQFEVARVQIAALLEIVDAGTAVSEVGVARVNRMAGPVSLNRLTPSLLLSSEPPPCKAIPQPTWKYCRCASRQQIHAYHLPGLS